MPENSLDINDVREIEQATAGAYNEAVNHEERMPPPEKKHPGYLAFKFTFTPSRGDVGGAFCMIFDGKNGKTVFQAFWVAQPYSGKVFNEPSNGWRKFVQRFKQMGPLNKDLGEKLQESLKHLIKPEDRQAMFNNYTKPKLRQYESLIRRNFEEITQCVFSAMSDAEPLARNELERAKVLKPAKSVIEKAEAAQRQKENEQKSQEEEKRKDTIVKCTHVLDPVKGKASSAIVPGDIIEVSVSDEGTGALINKFLIENNQSPVFPVETVEKVNNKAYIYVRINDEIRGLLTITKDVMLKVKGQPEQENNGKGLKLIEDMFFFGVLGAAIAGMIFVIRLFFM